MVGIRSYEGVLARFEQEGFRVGPHKAYLIARDALHAHPILVSDMDPNLAERLLFTPAATIDGALERVLSELPSDARIGIMPRASSTIPYIANQPLQPASRRNGSAD
jgi:hypothetical protein